jgi:hypothetical protein
MFMRVPLILPEYPTPKETGGKCNPQISASGNFLHVWPHLGMVLVQNKKKNFQRLFWFHFVFPEPVSHWASKR